MKVKNEFKSTLERDTPGFPSKGKYRKSITLRMTHSGTVKTGTGLLLLLALLTVLACSDRMPTEADFTGWLSSLYKQEMGINAAEIMICRWERTSRDITRLAPEVDGLRVEAAVFSTAGAEGLQIESGEPIVHYVFCRYYTVTDEWYLHAASWGGGFWKQDSTEWGHLVEECRYQAEQVKQKRADNNKRH